MVTTKDRPETPFQRRQRERRERAESEGFQRTLNAQASFRASLYRMARQIEEIVQAFRPQAWWEPMDPSAVMHMNAALARYSEAIEPWAQTTVQRMVREVNRRNLTAWRAHAEGMGAALQMEILHAPVGADLEVIMKEQVELIKSLPIEAGQRVHEMTLRAITEGARYRERTAIERGYDPEASRRAGRTLAPEGVWRRRRGYTGEPPELTTELELALKRAHHEESNQWIMNRATLIARTETARTASVLTQARAKHIGSTHYEWLTSGDARVRLSHKKLNHKIFEWAHPPESDPPHHSHPGQIWNCRCVALPIITDG